MTLCAFLRRVKAEIMEERFVVVAQQLMSLCHQVLTVLSLSQTLCQYVII